MKHSIVYSDSTMYAGWPANHGAWQWGDEMLFGFLRGKFKHKSMHNIAEPFEKVLARSLDGGRTWSIEKPITSDGFDCISPSSRPGIEFTPNSIVRVCGVYDHGGDYCDERGGFYVSHDRGHDWFGPYLFNGLDHNFTDGYMNTSRTRVHEDRIYLSYGQRDIWGQDATFCARYEDGNFVFDAVVCEDDARAVMPAVARVDRRLVCVMRRRKSGKREGWIDAYCSDDNTCTWRHLAFVASTGGHNGNPPALISTNNGRLICAYGNRDEGSMCYAISDDAGENWSTHLMRASEHDTSVDIGYPQLFARADGAIVCVYYWVSNDVSQQHIACTVL